MGYPEKNKNSLKVWQFVLLAALLITMLATMFMPAYSFGASAQRKMMEEIGDIAGPLAALAGTDISLGDKTDAELEEDLVAFEALTGVDLISIKPIDLMTYSGKHYQAMIDEMSGMQAFEVSGTVIINIIFIVIYVLAAMLLVFVIIAFATKMNKTVPIVLTAIYGFFTAIGFGFLRFGLIKTILKAALSTVSDLAGLIPGLGALGDKAVDETVKMVAKVLDPINSAAFLVAMIVGILLVVVCIIGIFTGGESYQQVPPYPPTPPHPPVETEEKVEPVQPVPPVQPVQPAIPQVGIMQGIAGVSTGKGFQIPATAKVVVGKSAQRANFIIEDPHVSNVHCSIRYIPATGMYSVIDHSSNGTYVNGTRLVKENAMMLPAGTILVIANENNKIKLG